MAQFDALSIFSLLWSLLLLLFLNYSLFINLIIPNFFSNKKLRKKKSLLLLYNSLTLRKNIGTLFYAN